MKLSIGKYSKDKIINVSKYEVILLNKKKKIGKTSSEEKREEQEKF